MEQGLVKKSDLQAIGNAIRGKNGTQNTYTPAEMADAISGLPSGEIPQVNVRIINGRLYGLKYYDKKTDSWPGKLDLDYTIKVDKGTVFKLGTPVPPSKFDYGYNRDCETLRYDNQDGQFIYAFFPKGDIQVKLKK